VTSLASPDVTTFSSGFGLASPSLVSGAGVGAGVLGF